MILLFTMISYMVASLGMKNTLGYDISISNIIEIDKGKWEVLMDQDSTK